MYADLTLVGVLEFDEKDLTVPHKENAVRPPIRCTEKQFKRDIRYAQFIKGAVAHLLLDALLPPTPLRHQLVTPAFSSRCVW